MRFGGFLAVACAVALTGCATTEQPAVSGKVEEYYSHPPTETPQAPLPVMAVIGDSFARDGADDWPTRTARCLGYRAAISGVRSSGFYSKGIDVPYWDPSRMNAVTADKPSIVIFETAYNDAVKAQQDQGAVEAAAVKTIESYRQAVPTATFIILGTFPTDRFQGPNTANNQAALESAAVKTGAILIKPTLEWQPSTDFTTADMTHPNGRGHRYIAKKLTEELKARGVVQTTGGCEYAS